MATESPVRGVSAATWIRRVSVPPTAVHGSWPVSTSRVPGAAGAAGSDGVAAFGTAASAGPVGDGVAAWAALLTKQGRAGNEDECRDARPDEARHSERPSTQSPAGRRRNPHDSYSATARSLSSCVLTRVRLTP